MLEAVRVCPVLRPGLAVNTATALISCRRLDLREHGSSQESRNMPQRPDVQVQRGPSTSAVAGLRLRSVRRGPISCDGVAAYVAAYPGLPLRPELAAPLDVWPSSQLAQCAAGRRCWRLCGDVAVLPCCTVYRISSSGRHGSDPSRLDQRARSVLSVRRRTALNCNPNCNPQIRRSMEGVRSVRRNPYRQVSILLGVRRRRHSPVPSGQSVRKL